MVERMDYGAVATRAGAGATARVKQVYTIERSRAPRHLRRFPTAGGTYHSTRVAVPMPGPRNMALSSMRSAP